MLLWPSVVLWGSGTAIGELPPYFITRAAKRAGTKATDYEAELEEAANATDIVSKLKVRAHPIRESQPTAQPRVPCRRVCCVPPPTAHRAAVCRRLPPPTAPLWPHACVL